MLFEQPLQSLVMNVIFKNASIALYRYESNQWLEKQTNN